MNIKKQAFSSIWLDEDQRSVNIIDQSLLPYEFKIVKLNTLAQTVAAIKDMQVRGAPLIGITAAFGLALALGENTDDKALEQAYQTLLATRPTAVNLRWALDHMLSKLLECSEDKRVSKAYELATELRKEDIELCQSIGQHGLKLIKKAQTKKSPEETINILTHCNAGWLATVDWGTALSPIYLAHNAGIKVHVWVDETRPRNQGASLTALELSWHGIPHTIIADNTGGLLMQQGEVDLCIVGSDRIGAKGHVVNKIGTYLKALAAHANQVPFYVAFPYSTIDWRMLSAKDVKIEIRSAAEVTHITGLNEAGGLTKIRICPEGSSALNYGFDITPGHLVTAFITEKGSCNANEEGLKGLYS